MTDIDSFIRKHVRKILVEATPSAGAGDADQSQSDSTTIRRGKIGRGRISAASIEAGALALEDPQKLLKKLGISKSPSGSGPDRVLNLLKAAIQEKTVMSQAYLGLEVKENEDGESYIRIRPAEGLSERNAALYMLHVLVAAKGLIGNIGVGVVVGLDDANQAVIQFEKKRSA